MAIQYTERPNFTREQLEEHVMQTLELADGAGLDDADRAVLLPAIFDKVCSKQIVAEQVQALPFMRMPRAGE